MDGEIPKVGNNPVTVSPFIVVATVPPPVQIRDKVPVKFPPEEGLARSTTVQVPVGASELVPQLSVTIEKSVVFERDGAVHPVAAPFPELVSVKV